LFLFRKLLGVLQEVLPAQFILYFGLDAKNAYTKKTALGVFICMQR